MDITDPKPLPDFLKQYPLTFVEQQVISLIHVQQFVYIRGSGSMASKGHCLNFAQDIKPLVKTLPRLASEIPIIIFKSKNESLADVLELRVRRKYIQIWLEFLQKNSIVPEYQRLDINSVNYIDRLNKLPINGLIDLKIISTKEVLLQEIEELIPFEEQNTEFSQNLHNENICNTVEENLSQSMSQLTVTENLEPIFESGVWNPPNQAPLQNDLLLKKIDEMIDNNSSASVILDYPTCSEISLNDYSTPYLAAKAFPTLFPYGTGDPWAVIRNSDGKTILEKSRHLLRYCEVSNGKREFRFAKNSRFVLWLYNILFRNRVNEAGNVYLNYKQEHSNLTLEELKLKINTKQNDVIKSMQHFTSDIPGTPSYWHRVMQDCKAIINDKDGPSAFFTFSFATHHDPYLHNILGLAKNASKVEIDEAIKNAPLIVNEYFTIKIKTFVDEYFVKHLKATPEHGGWYWYRYEWQFRDAIHVHGLIKIGNTSFNPYEASNLIIKAYELKLKIIEEDRIETDAELSIFEQALQKEQELIEFNQRYTVTDTNITFKEWSNNFDKSNILPMKLKPTDVKDENKIEDITNLAFLLQYHRCKVNRCQKIINNKITQCRFQMPKPECNEPYIELYRKQNIDKTFGPWHLRVIMPRINEQRIINFNFECMHLMRCNQDFSIATDIHRIILYTLKYAAKCETKSSVFSRIYDHIMKEVNLSSDDPRCILKLIMERVMGERDVSANEAMHLILDLGLYQSNITVVKTSLDESKRLKKSKMNQLELQDSYYNLYAERSSYLKHDLSNYNFIDFVKQFNSTKYMGLLSLRENPDKIAVRIFQEFSSSAKSPNYWKYCKYQLLRYKPWQYNHNNVLPKHVNGSIDDSCLGWIKAWAYYLNEEKNKSLENRRISNWEQSLEQVQQALNETTNYYTSSEDENEDYLKSNDDDNYSLTDNELHSTDHDYESYSSDDDFSWNEKNLNNETRKNPNYLQSNIKVFETEYWETTELIYDAKELEHINTWLETKKLVQTVGRLRPYISLESLDIDQKKIFNYINRRVTNNSQFFIRIEGKGGCGKSHLLNALCSYFNGANESIKMIRVCAPTGTSAYQVYGETYHALLNININNKVNKLKCNYFICF